MELTILGYWGAYPFKKEGTSAYLLESEGFRLMIDCGSAALIALEEQMDPLLLDAVILSHYHHDHIADVGVLQYLRQLKPNPHKMFTEKELPIYGHNETPMIFDSLTMAGVSKGVAYNATQELQVGPFDISFLKTIHPVPCYAMRIVERKTQKTLVYTADSGFFSELIDFSAGADVLLADTYFFNGTGNPKVHMTAGEVGYLAKEAKVSQLVLTHLPQVGALDELLEQAVEASGMKYVQIAEKNKKLIIS